MSENKPEYVLKNNLLKNLRDSFIEPVGLLDQIDKKLNTSFCLNLYGLSGSGKTTYACEYAYKYFNSKYSIVHLFEADCRDKLNIEFRVYLNLKDNLNVVETEQNNIFEHIKSNNFNNNEPTLFIFDNLQDNYQYVLDYLQILPKNVKVILTSTKSIKDNFFSNIEIKPFKKESTEKYFTNLLKIHSNKIKPKEVSKIFESLKIKPDSVLPAKLRNVNFLLSTYELSIEELTKEIQLLKLDQAELSILIKKSLEDENILPIVKLISFLESGLISFDLMLTLVEFKKEDLKYYLNSLIKLGLVEKYDKYGKLGVRMNENTQSEIIKFLNMNMNTDMDMKSIYFGLLKSLSKLFKINNPWSDWLELSFLYFHVVKLLRMTRVFYDNISENNDFDLKCKDLMSELSKNAGIYNIYVLTSYKNGIYYFNEYYKLRNDIHRNEPHKTKADALQYIGLCYFKLNDFNHLITAIAYYNDACSMKKELFKTEIHSEIAVLKHNIGICYDKMNNIDEAIKFKRQSLKIRQNLGDLNEIAKSLNSLAVTYEKSGDLNKAIYYDKKTLEIRRQIYKSKHSTDSTDTIHPEVADSIYYLGISSMKLNDWNSAVVYFEELYNIYKAYHSRGLFVDQKKLANVINNISLSYLNLGLQDKADYFKKKYDHLNISHKIEPDKNRSDIKVLDDFSMNDNSVLKSNIESILTKSLLMPSQSPSNIEINKTKETTRKVNDPKEWTKDLVLDYLKNENINPKLFNSLCSPSIDLNGNVLNDYYLILSHNSSFFKQLLKLQSENIEADDIEKFIFSLRKLFSP